MTDKTWPGYPDDGFLLMPTRLTAENGAKYALSGEFFVDQEVVCDLCDSVDLGPANCKACHGNGTYTVRVPIPWPTIKEIYKRTVMHFMNSRGDITGDPDANS